MDGEKVGDWKEWGMHVLHELKRLNCEQQATNDHIASLLQFRSEAKAGAKISAILVSAFFGLVSLAVTVMIALHGVK